MDNDGLTFLEKAIRHGAKYQELINSSQISMFENESIANQTDLVIPDCEEWINLERLKKERSCRNIYICSST